MCVCVCVWVCVGVCACVCVCARALACGSQATVSQFQCNINEDLILSMAQAIKQQQLDVAGYTVVAIDDCWQAPQRVNGR